MIKKQLTLIIKMYDESRGRWMDISSSELYPIGTKITLGDGKTYVVKSNNGSRVDLEEENND